ncbi:RNA polymerase subunit sigma-70 [Nocardia fusca]|uniref:RNA polymerase subunit sigma-70 n=1 Tax=Nocardia fusca TaxID=941183 RepID=UPI0037C8C4CE
MTAARTHKLDPNELIQEFERLRRELTVLCYRMSGSIDEAEDLVQDTYLRAWRAADRFEGRSSLRTWLYRIATNVCLTALEREERRMLPSGLVPTDPEPVTSDSYKGPSPRWLTPAPDRLAVPLADDPAEITVTRSHLRLAIIAALQFLPPRQRVVLLLRDVLAFPASDVANFLGISTPAVKSLLQRARGRMDEVSPQPDAGLEPEDPAAQALVNRYMTVFQEADVTLLEQVLRDDASIEVAPMGIFKSGKEVCIPYLTDSVLRLPGEYRMLPTSANGQPAAVAYRRGKTGEYQAFGLSVLTVTSEHITRISVFADGRFVERWGFPPELVSPS